MPGENAPCVELQDSMHGAFLFCAALLSIRDGRGYRFEYGTFEEYCKERWGMVRQRAYQLIEAAVAIGNLSTQVDILPQYEKHTRPLTQLNDNPELQRETWQRAE